PASSTRSSPLLLWPPPGATLFPYTTLFRSVLDGGGQRALVGDDLQTALVDDLVRGALAREDALDDLAGQLVVEVTLRDQLGDPGDRKSTRLNSSHVSISYAVFCLKKKKKSR